MSIAMCVGLQVAHIPIHFATTLFFQVAALSSLMAGIKLPRSGDKQASFQKTGKPLSDKTSFLGVAKQINTGF